MNNHKLLLFAVFLLLSGLLFSQSTQWRGLNRTGHYPEEGLMDSWPEEGPPLLFVTKDVGKGYSQPVLSDNRIYITGKKDSMDYVTAVDLQGEIVWSVPYGKAWTRSFSETRSTPTIDGNFIYLTSGNGELACVNKQNGELVWNVDIQKAFDVKFGSWGHAESPLVYEDKVFTTAAGAKTTMVALNKANGEVAWSTKVIDNQNAFVSPTLIRHNEKPMIVGLTSTYLFAVDPEDGEVIWKYDYTQVGSAEMKQSRKRNNATTPLYKDGYIYITSGYDHGGAKLKLNEAGTEVQLIWTDNTLDVHHGGAVIVENTIYGSNWLNNKKGKWVALDFEIGDVTHIHEWNTKGSIVYADGLLYLYEEQRGEVGLVKPDPDEFKLISSFRISEGSGPHWAHPSIYDGKLLIRHGEALMVYDIQKKE